MCIIIVAGNKKKDRSQAYSITTMPTIVFSGLKPPIFLNSFVVGFMCCALSSSSYAVSIN